MNENDWPCCQYPGQRCSVPFCQEFCPKGISVSAPEPDPNVEEVGSNFAAYSTSMDEAPAPTNPKQAYGDLKLALHLVPVALECSAARALKEGARKYGAFNWRKDKVEALTYVGAIKRHLAAWVDGEEIDPESAEGKHHLDGVAASLAILLDAKDGGFLIDNRPPPGPGPKLVLTPKMETK